jgi:2-methylisocitrate lyase-like PEP mutase family enzyme
VARVVSGIMAADAVGINIEEGANSPEILCGKIEAARQSARRTNCDLSINVRTDVYLRQLATATQGTRY